jgi:hypothetical protein
MKKNTCDEINSWFEAYLDRNGHEYYRDSPFFAFGLKYCAYTDTILIHSDDEGGEKCENQLFSDFAV